MSLIKCEACGKEISDTCEKCVHCGNAIVKKAICPECGAEVSVTQDICSNCGNKMKKEKVVRVSKKRITILLIIAIIVVVAIIIGSSSTGVDLKEVYASIGADSEFCYVSADGSYLEIDTNPDDKDDYYSFKATEYVKKANEELGFSEALFSRMGKTRALDGTLDEENDYVRVTWTYHPDKGLQVVYALK